MIKFNNQRKIILAFLDFDNNVNPKKNVSNLIVTSFIILFNFNLK